MFLFQLPGFESIVRPIQDRLECGRMDCRGQGHPDCPLHPLTCGCDWAFTCTKHEIQATENHLADLQAAIPVTSPDSLPALHERINQIIDELEAKHAELYAEDPSQEALAELEQTIDLYQEVRDSIPRHRSSGGVGSLWVKRALDHDLPTFDAGNRAHAYLPTR
jgi:hypothetical protein